MSSSSPPNVGDVDLESVLNIRRRTLTAIGEKGPARHQYRYTDTIYLKREDHSNSLFSIESKIVIFGELHFLFSVFERYTSNIIVYEESNQSDSNKSSFSTTFEEEELVDEVEDMSIPAVVSTLRQTSTSSSSPPNVPSSPTRRKRLGSLGRSVTVASSASEYSMQNLEGKRYGCIQLPNMTIIEILEILMCTGLDLVDETSEYDKSNVLHQGFVLSKSPPTAQRIGQPLYSRSSSFVGT